MNNKTIASPDNHAMPPISITIFNGEGSGKVPISKNNENTFIFITKQTDTLKDAMSYMNQHFTLSKPLNLQEPVVKKRRVSELKEYFPTQIYNIALDLDEITTQEAYYATIDFFNSKGFSVILAKSRSFNGKDKFNMKGIMRVNLSNKPEIIKAALNGLQSELSTNAKVDLTVANAVSIQAPSKDDFIIFYRESGTIISDADIAITHIKETLSTRPDIVYNNNIVDKSLEIFWSLGYKMIKESNDNGSINFSHFSERKSKGGYFWFASNPFIMNHHSKEKTVSIFKIIKDTPEGKVFLKDKTKEEQRMSLIKNQDISSYKKYLIVNERYLDFKKADKQELLEEWSNSQAGVLKIKSAMGTAKSSGIELAVKLTHEKGEKVILVSNRVSVARDYAEKYNIALYSHPDSVESTESIVVQYDSLHKYNLSYYDVVIFDEFVSLLLHHRANLTSNANINAVKFKILLENKKVLIADAFLTGYEDEFFKDRELFSIQNEYKDNVDLYHYKNKEFFITSIVDRACALEPDEHISCSFTSLNVMRVTEQELKNHGIKVVTLSSETSELTREIIYRRFKENTHGAFQVILFTPTLTVGVSNLNNNPIHFHYDSGMSTDVVSSLQMTKRSRGTKEIHFYLEERQFYYDTDYNSLNSLAEKNINMFYNKKDKTLLVDIDYTTGHLTLTPLARYINKIEVFYNVLENNHANAFNLLLNYQFDACPEQIDTVDRTFTVQQKVLEVKEQIKAETKELLEKYSDIVWNPIELEEIKFKTSDKTQEEQAKLIIGTIQEKFKKIIPKERLFTLAQLEIESDYKFVAYVKNMKMFLNNNDSFTSYRLSKAISEDISSLQNRSHIEFLEYLLGNKEKLKSFYSRNEIKAIDIEVDKGKKFEKFLKKLGFQWSEARLKVQKDVFDYIEYL